MLDWYIYQTIDRHSDRAREGERQYWIREALSGAEPGSPGALGRLENWLGSYLVTLGRHLQRQSGVEAPAQPSQRAAVVGTKTAAAPHGMHFTLTGPAGDTMVRM